MFLALKEMFNYHVAKLDEHGAKLDEHGAKLDELQKDMKKIKGKFGVDADDLAKQVTVAVYYGKETNHDLSFESEPSGHGLLVSFNGESQTKLFLLSAAHVIVGLLESKNNNGVVQVGWTSDVQLVYEIGQVYMDKRYILEGTHDIGLVEIAATSEFSHEGFDLQMVPVKCLEGAPIGCTAIGHGLVYLEGKILKESVDGSSPRVLINAMSVGGCSGCPLFTSMQSGGRGLEASLYAIVHGDSKHRQRLGSTSSHLFADKLMVPPRSGQTPLTFQAISMGDNIKEALIEAENLFPETDDTQKEYELRSRNCPDIIINIASALEIPFRKYEKHSIDSMMVLLSESAFPVTADDSHPSIIMNEANRELRCAIPVPTTERVEEGGGSSQWALIEREE